MALTIQIGPGLLLEADGGGLSIFAFHQREANAPENGFVKHGLDGQRNIIERCVLRLGNEIGFKALPPFSASFDRIAIVRQRLADIEDAGHGGSDIGEQRGWLGHYKKLLEKMEPPSVESQTGARSDPQ